MIAFNFIICNPLQILQIERDFKPLNLSRKIFSEWSSKKRKAGGFQTPPKLGRNCAPNSHVCLSTLGVLASLRSLPTCCAVPGSWFWYKHLGADFGINIWELILALNTSPVFSTWKHVTQLKGCWYWRHGWDIERWQLMPNKRLHKKNGTHWNKWKRVCSAVVSELHVAHNSVQQLFLCQVSLRAHVSGCRVVLVQKFPGNPDPRFGQVLLCAVRLSRVQVLTSVALHCQGPGDPPRHHLRHPLLSSVHGVWHLSRGSRTRKDVGV